jgi:hypothetical protein
MQIPGELLLAVRLAVKVLGKAVKEDRTSREEGTRGRVLVYEQSKEYRQGRELEKFQGHTGGEQPDTLPTLPFG